MENSKKYGEVVETYPIDGLKWISRWAMNNGPVGSFVVPFATTLPVNLVNHGQEEFHYGQYGIHIGQQDQLTFFGHENQIVKAKFIDCRKNSPTKRTVLEVEFSPSFLKTLIIPPGVAHTFWNLQNVYTLNDYKLLLPDPSIAISNLWKMENDIINIPLDSVGKDVELYEVNCFEADNSFYYKIRDKQRKNLESAPLNHAFTKYVNVENENYLVKLKEKENKSIEMVDKNITFSINGVSLKKHFKVVTGAHSSILPFLDESPFYVVVHGSKKYSLDSYGLHLGQEDRLTFVGEEKDIKIELLDCRKDSPDFGKKETIKVRSNNETMLIIPPGVAHFLWDLENVFTINRPRLFWDPDKKYKPGLDVIDLPYHLKEVPAYLPNLEEWSTNDYEVAAQAQLDVMNNPPLFSSIKSQMVEIDHKKFKIVIRKAVNA